MTEINILITKHEAVYARVSVYVFARETKNHFSMKMNFRMKNACLSSVAKISQKLRQHTKISLPKMS